MSNHRALPVKYIKCGIGLCSLIIVLQLHDNYRLWLQVSKLITTFQLHCFIQRCCYLHDIVQMLGNRLTENNENFASHGVFAWDSGSIWRVKDDWGCGAPNMIQCSSWPEQWHAEHCHMYKAVILTMVLLNEELGKMKKVISD